MKILQVNCVYGKGSTGKITRDLHRSLSEQGIESVVCYGRGQKVSEPHVYKTCGEFYSKMNNLWTRITGVLYGGLFFSTNRLISVIRKEKPDIVHLQCINGYFVNIYRLINWLKKNHIKTVVTLHAEFMYTANCGHALECERWKTGCGKCPHNKKETRSWFFDNTALSFRKMKRAFDGFDDGLTIVSVSPWLMERAKQSPILADKRHAVVYNGVDTDLFHPRDTQALREKHGLTDEAVVFHATPHFSDDPDHHKGGYYVMKLAEMNLDKNIRFFVAGNHQENLQVPDNVVLLGNISDQSELAKYYSMADATLLTSKKETFSMVAAESLCCGTPVVGFKAGGPEMIALPQYSTFVSHGDISGLNTALLETLRHGRRAASDEARARYSRETMVRGMIEIYQK